MKKLKLGDKVRTLVDFKQDDGSGNTIFCPKGTIGIIVDIDKNEYLIEVGTDYSDSETYGYYSIDQLAILN